MPEQEPSGSFDRLHRDYEAITSRRLTPELIRTYGEVALRDMVTLVASSLTEYNRQPTIEVDATPAEREDIALNYLGLRSVSAALEQIETVTQDITTINRLIAKLEAEQRVILPPDQLAPRIRSSKENDETQEWGDRDQQDRLKSILFLLKQDFSLDIEDSDEVEIRLGTNTPSMMRQHSYCLVKINQLQKTLLVCDERGNVTYILDSHALADADVDDEFLVSSTKKELDALLKHIPAVGRRLVYSSRYLANIRSALSSDAHPSSRPNMEQDLYLQPTTEQPAQLLSKHQLAKKIGVSHQLIQTAIDELDQDLGDLHTVRRKNTTTIRLTPDQQERIEHHLRERGSLVGEAPTGYTSIRALGELLGVSAQAVQRAFDDKFTELGDVQRAKFGPARTWALSPGQQAILKQELERKGILVAPPPAGYVSFFMLVRELQSSPVVINPILDELGDALGDVIDAKFTKVTAKAYSPAQQEMIRAALETRRTTGGLMNLKALAERLGLAPQTVQKAIDTIEPDKLGTIQWGQFRNTYSRGYSYDQYLIIRAQLEERNKLIGLPPKGYASRSHIAKETNSTYHAVQAAIEELGDALGDVVTAKFGSNVAKAYSPTQQALIKKQIYQSGRS